MDGEIKHWVATWFLDEYLDCHFELIARDTTGDGVANRVDQVGASDANNRNSYCSIRKVSTGEFKQTTYWTDIDLVKWF